MNNTLPASDLDDFDSLFANARGGLTDTVVAIDPLKRLLDPNFTERLWEYEHSRTEPEIPGSLHQKQMDVLRSNARNRWLFWGNQVGKTTLGAVECVLIALGRHPYHQRWTAPVTIWASALTWELWEKILLPELLTWIPPDRIIDAPKPYMHSTKRDILIRADNGKVSRITGKAAEQGADKYQSARVHVVWLDEEHPESVWNEMQPRLLRHGGITIATMTPLKGFTWVYHRVYEPWKKGKVDAERVFCSHAGLADNPAISPEEIAELDEALKHNPAQLAARKFGMFVKPEGLALNLDPAVHYETLTHEQAKAIVSLGQVFGGLDFGSWRFAFTLFAADRDGVVHRLDECYDQRRAGDIEGAPESPLQRRAQLIVDMAKSYGLDELKIWGDTANQTDIAEINTAFRKLKSQIRVTPVGMENKVRTASVDRINDLLGRKALLFRKNVMAGQVWMMGMNAANAGTPIEGSRLLWEIGNWSYPKPAEGKAQKQDPDDNTADGADAIASARYALMSWWKAASPEKDEITEKPNHDTGFEKALERIVRQQKRPGKSRRGFSFS